MNSNLSPSESSRYLALFENLAVGIILFDQHDQMVDMNTAAQRILEGHPEASDGRWGAWLAERFLSGSSAPEFEQDGRLYQINRAWLRDENGSPAGRYVLIQDVSSFKSALVTANHPPGVPDGELLILKNLAEALNQTLPPEKALEAGLRIVADHIGAQSGWLLTITPDQKAERSAGYNLPQNLDLTRQSAQPWPLCNCLKEAIQGRLNAPIRILDCERLARTPGMPEDQKQHLSIPIHASGAPVGILNLVIHSDRQFNSAEIRLLSALGDQFGGAIERARLFKEVHKLATTDGLTGLPNRRHFFNMLNKELDRSVRYKHPISLAMLDIDYFKQVNDTFGHLAGDSVLQTIAKTCQETIRKTDVIGRFGGEEIVILMPETTQQSAQRAMERLRRKVELLEINTQRGTARVTISAGMTFIISGERIAPEKFLDRADQALYRAKENGRNRIWVWSPHDQDE